MTEQGDGDRATPVQPTDDWRVYLAARRDWLIAELRMVDKLLGRPQTIPQRRRG